MQWSWLNVSWWILERTAEGDPGGGNDAGLYHGVLLAGEGLLEEAAVLEDGGEGLHDRKTEEASGRIEWGDHPGGEVELADDEVEHQAQEEPRRQRPNSQLLPPVWHRGLPERLLGRQPLVFRVLIILRHPDLRRWHVLILKIAPSGCHLLPPATLDSLTLYELSKLFHVSDEQLAMIRKKNQATASLWESILKGGKSDPLRVVESVGNLSVGVSQVRLS